jgi:translation initiation factor 1
MAEICPKCGLPKEICACEAIGKETVAQLRIYAKQERFKKWVTVVEGLKGEELENTAKELKRALACGGTYKTGAIVLQGDHRDKVKDILVRMGYPKENIVVS